MIENALSPGKAILVFVAFLIILFTVAILKKIYYRIRHKKRFYIIPRVSVKGIANIAMVIAISITVIMLLTIITADLFNVVFRAWPGTRVTIEGILIKIGGLLFGPFLGIFIGGMTDLLAVAMTAGVFHYGYLIAAMAYGLIAGVIREIFSYAKKKDIRSAIWSTVILAVIEGCVMFFLWWQSGKGIGIYALNFLGLHIEMSGYVMMAIIGSFILLAMVVVWIAFGFRKYQIKKQKSFGLVNSKSNWYPTFVVVLVAVVICDALINVLMMPSFDAQLSSLGYVQWVAIRAVIFIPEILLNLLIIFPIFKIVVPLINYDYRQDLVEDRNVPVYVN